MIRFLRQLNKMNKYDFFVLKHPILSSISYTIVPIVWLVYTVIFLLIPELAHADPKPGLWLEQSTGADGFVIRKVRDTTGGDYNVCYIASHIDLARGEIPIGTPAVSISCVAEKRP